MTFSRKNQRLRIFGSKRSRRKKKKGPVCCCLARAPRCFQEAALGEESNSAPGTSCGIANEHPRAELIMRDARRSQAPCHGP